MRDSFILSADKNNGYPSFSDAPDFEGVNYCLNSKMFIDDGTFYPRYSGINAEAEIFSHYSRNTLFVFPDINDGYPVFLFWHGLRQKVISEIFSGENPAQIIYYRDMPVKSIYFREKAVYKFGFSE